MSNKEVSVIKGIAGLLDTAESKVGYVIGRISQPNRHWMQPQSVTTLRARLVNLQRMCEAAVAQLDTHRPTPPTTPTNGQ